MKNIFITGTDTDCGKTVVSAALLSLLLGRKINAGYMKPIQTGCIKNGAVIRAPDVDFVLKVCNISVSPSQYELISPYKFILPASPHLAAEQESIEISIDNIIETSACLNKSYDHLIIEGAGGILVPLSNNIMMLDLIKRLRYPVILVTRTSLGTINHTLLSIHELLNAGCYIAGLIFCETKLCDYESIKRDNIEIIARLTKLPVLGIIPFTPDFEQTTGSAELFYKFCNRNLNKTIDILMRDKVI